MPNHKVAVQAVLTVLTSEEHGVIAGMDEIDAVGHRVVHGGEKFSSSAMITPEVKRAIRACYDLAPLHNPPNMTGIEAVKKPCPVYPRWPFSIRLSTRPCRPVPTCMPCLMTCMKSMASADTAFMVLRMGMSPVVAAAILQAPFETLKIITCHLGNGSSIAAIKYGKSIDTSMGLTPLAGLCMGTRCGDIDPAIVTFLMEKEKLDTREVDDMLNKKSGVAGISGVSSDFRDLYTAAGEGINGLLWLWICSSISAVNTSGPIQPRWAVSMLSFSRPALPKTHRIFVRVPVKALDTWVFI